MTDGAFFFTDIDPRAAVKGSRDPLGLVPIWGRVGRRLVGNLTTASGSLRGFTTLLLAHSFAEQVEDRLGRKSESKLDLFLKFEQLAAYCRLNRGDREFRGIERAGRFLADGKGPRLSARSDDQIMTNQKVYGLWGLYSVPSQRSRLLQADENALTPEARAFVEDEYLRPLALGGSRQRQPIAELLEQPVVKLELEGRHAPIAKALGHLLTRSPSQKERSFYGERLVHGGPGDSTGGLQRALVSLLPEDGAMSFDRPRLRAVLKDARKRPGIPDGVPVWLDRIDAVESLLAPADRLYRYLLGREGKRLTDIEKEVQKAWGKRLPSVRSGDLEPLRLDLGLEEEAAGRRWEATASALAGGDYGAAIRLLLEQNADVMKKRGGAAAWTEVRDGRLKVRFRDETGLLGDGDSLADAWRHDFFLNSLQAMASQLGAR
jgi:hypothetical protein